jgi:hypothetical protein
VHVPNNSSTFGRVSSNAIDVGYAIVLMHKESYGPAGSFFSAALALEADE